MHAACRLARGRSGFGGHRAGGGTCIAENGIHVLSRARRAPPSPRLPHLHWHLVAGEYPPSLGGVADYTHLVAHGLARAGETVHVWIPGDAPDRLEADGVVVHPALGDMLPAALRRASRRLAATPGPRRLLVQWVPHDFGLKSLNLAFPWWLGRRAAAGDELRLMVHEPGAAFRGRGRDHVLAAGHRLMAAMLMRHAPRIWVSTLATERVWRPWAFGRAVRFDVLPVPSTIPVTATAEQGAATRARVAPPGATVIGHFGTFGPLVTRTLGPALRRLLAGAPDRVALLIGAGGDRCRDELLADDPALAGRVVATGAVDAGAISAHLLACDVMLQPYPDGVTTRRSSAMAALAHGRALVASAGELTEPGWADADVALLAAADDVAAHVAATERLLADPLERERLAARGRRHYAARFDIAHTIRALRAS